MEVHGTGRHGIKLSPDICFIFFSIPVMLLRQIKWCIIFSKMRLSLVLKPLNIFASRRSGMDTNQAYFCLHDGYVMSGPQTASLLLSELTNLRFKPDETASGFCLRLRELFEDLEMMPGDASVKMHDTQKIGYLLTGIRQEKSLDSVYVAIQSGPRRDAITFEEACEDLHHRCKAIQADQLLFTQVKGSGRKVLVTTQCKRQNKDIPADEKKQCLEKDCTEMIKPYLPLCPLHYHQCVSGKIQALKLKSGLGSAVYNAATHAMVHHSTVPQDRIPIPKANLKSVKRKGLVANFRLPTFSANLSIPIGYDADIDYLGLNNISHQTGENRTVEPQADTNFLRIRLDAEESTLALDPSFPLQDEVTPNS
jgi:hypothetical protein